MKSVINKDLRFIILFSLLLVIGSCSNSFASTHIISQISTPGSEHSTVNDNGHVVWSAHDGTDWEIFFYDGTTTTQLTNNTLDDAKPIININGEVVWYTHDGTDWEILYYDGTTTTQLTNNTVDDYGSTINANGDILWHGWDGTDWEIFYYDGATTTQLTNNTLDDAWPVMNENGQAVWFGWDGADLEIFYYDGTTTTQLTNNIFDDAGPSINANGHAVWHGWDGTDFEIFHYDGTTTTQITDNSLDDGQPVMNANGNIVWHGWDGTDVEIFYYEGGTTTQLTDNEYNDVWPDISNYEDIVWEGDEYIYLASPPNFPPVADAGADQNVFLSESALLEGSATDPDNDPIIAWQWEIVSQPLGSSPGFGPVTTPTPTFVPDMLGDYVFALYATDGRNNVSLAATVTVHVAQNLPPAAVILSDVTTGLAPLTVNFDGTTSSDPEGGALTYSWTFGDGSVSSVTSPTNVFTTPGDYVVSLAVLDDFGQTSEDTLLITVTAPNTAPIASPTATPSSGIIPVTVQFIANASDADGDALTYAWSFGDPASPDNASSTADPVHTYTAAGTYVAWLTVSDGTDGVSNSLTIVADSPVVPGLSLTTIKGKIKFVKKDRTRSKVHLDMDVTPETPAPDDVISISVDGIELFSVPFSDFVLAGDDDEDDDEDDHGDDDDTNPYKYKYKTKKIKVEFDIAKGWLEVSRRKIALHTLDASNGVDVELHIGDSVAVENLAMNSHGGKKGKQIKKLTYDNRGDF